MSHILAPIISELFNMSILEVFSLVFFLIGCIKLIFKLGKKDHMTNCKPITTLPVLAKLFDKSADMRMMCFINRFNLLNSN